MGEHGRYVVRFSGLSQGTHHFDFEADDSFFAQFEKSEIAKGHVKVLVTLEKQSVVMRLAIKCEGSVEVMCDYCAQPFMIPVSGEQAFVIKLGNEEAGDEGDADIIYLPLQEHEIDITDFIYEVIILSIPLRRVHPEGECDPEMVKSIKKYASQTEKDSADPRWDALKDLKNKLN